MIAFRYGLTLALFGLILALGVAAAPSASSTPAPALTARFAAIGDYGTAGQPEQDVATLVHSWNPEFVLTVGDNNYPDGAANTIDPNIGQYYHDFIFPYTGSYGPGAPFNQFWPALGNHDWNTPGAQPYLDYFTLPNNERYYEQVIGPVHLFAIDSDPHEPDGITVTSTQALWLQSRLAAATEPWKVVYMHHPPYSSGINGSTPALQWPYREWGASAVLAGHDHHYERILDPGTGFPYFVDGSGGTQLYPTIFPIPGSQVRYWLDYGAVRLDATDTTLRFQFINRANALIDTYTLTLGVPTLTATPALTATPTATHTPSPSYTPIPTNTPPPTPVLTCVPAWDVVSSPQLSDLTTLQSVTTITSNDVWAVGSYAPTGQGGSRTQIMHWDGTAWTVVPGPNLGASNNALNSVAAVTSTDVWAVGFYFPNTVAQTLILHWNGASWSRIPSPNVGSGHNTLSGVAAHASNDVWAVGDYNYPASRPLILHWDGTAWAAVPGPTLTSYSVLSGITALSPTNVWAVGYLDSGSHNYHTLIMHWDGSEWSVTPSPNPGVDENSLASISAVTPDDIWAVGRYGRQVGPLYTLLLHWNGSQWESFPSTTIGSLHGVTMISSNDGWAVGNTGYTLILHWDGVTWRTVFSPNPGYPQYMLAAVQAVTNEDIWTVGSSNRMSDIALTLTEHYTGRCVTATPTVPVSSTPGVTATMTPTVPVSSTPGVTATATPTVPVSSTPGVTATATPSPTPSPTVCPIQFNDVPPGSTFYAFIRCLACRGIFSGYPCGGPGEPCPGAYFRPGANVTRGQTAKIVSNAAGYSETPTGQTFEDVPPTGTFYLWVERIASRGIISGYPCGQPGEPCLGPGNRPYFRPNNNVTRGQLAKIDANAAQYTETPIGQTFEDAPPGSTFYLWIERIAARGIISGYPCGGPGEPCVAPANRAYFRPNASVTRSQTAKIVANTFFPACATPQR
jgi:hypothetical protein